MLLKKRIHELHHIANVHINYGKSWGVSFEENEKELEELSSSLEEREQEIQVLKGTIQEKDKLCEELNSSLIEKGIEFEGSKERVKLDTVFRIEDFKKIVVEEVDNISNETGYKVFEKIQGLIVDLRGDNTKRFDAYASKNEKTLVSIVDELIKLRQVKADVGIQKIEEHFYTE